MLAYTASYERVPRRSGGMSGAAEEGVSQLAKGWACEGVVIRRAQRRESLGLGSADSAYEKESCLHPDKIMAWSQSGGMICGNS